MICDFRRRVLVCLDVINSTFLLSQRAEIDRRVDTVQRIPVTSAAVRPFGLCISTIMYVLVLCVHDFRQGVLIWIISTTQTCYSHTKQRPTAAWILVN